MFHPKNENMKIIYRLIKHEIIWAKRFGRSQFQSFFGAAITWALLPLRLVPFLFTFVHVNFKIYCSFVPP